MRTRRKTGSYEVGRARRESIIEAATKKFAESGYHRSSMTRIAQDVGLTQSGLMHYFPSKQHLLLAVAERRLLNTATWWGQLPEDHDGLGALRGMVLTTEKLLTEPGLIELFVLVSAQAVDSASTAKELYAEWYEIAINALHGMFIHGVEAGHLRAELDYRAIAEEAIAITDGLQLQWVISGGTLDLVGRVETYTARLALDISSAGVPSKWIDRPNSPRGKTATGHDAVPE